MTLVTVVKTQLNRCDWKITLIKNGIQVSANEINGDEGQAAAFAINIAAQNRGAKIIASAAVMKIIGE